MLRIKHQLFQIPSNEEVTILQWNANGVRRKMLELKTFLKQNNVMIAAIQETKLSEKTEFRVPGYAIFRADRGTDHGAGGLAILIHSSITAEKLKIPPLDPANATGSDDEEREEQNPPEEGEQIEDGNEQTNNEEESVPEDANWVRPLNELTEVQGVTVYLKQQKLHVVNVYNPPNINNFDPAFLAEIPAPCLIMGDFNAHSPLWNSSYPRDREGKKLENLLEDLAGTGADLSVVAGKHRHERQSLKTPSTPDVTLASQTVASRLRRIVLDNDLGSDHAAIIIETCQKQDTHFGTRKPRTMWNFKRAKWHDYRKELDKALQEADLPKGNSTTEEDLKLFTAAMLKAAKTAIPKGRRRCRIIQFPRAIRLAIKARRKARAAFLKNPTPALRILANRTAAVARRLLSTANRTSWQKYCSGLSLKQHSRKIYATLKSILNGRKEVNEPLEANGVTATTPIAKANMLNTHYAAVNNQHTTEDGKPVSLSNRDKRLIRSNKRFLQENGPFDQWFSADFTMKELSEALRAIPLRKAAGPDNVHPEFLAELSIYAKAVLLELLNNLWSASIYPLNYKTPVICPILKPGKPANQCKSFRPIAMTSPLGKTFERMIANRLSRWLEDNKKLTSCQAGFRKRHRTTDHAVSLAERITSGFQRKENTGAVFFDMQAAYDTVWHVGLLYKMTMLGIRGNMLRTIHSFLSDRRITTRLANHKSTAIPVADGLPQGAVLSPLLFLIYINDLPEALPGAVETPIFADDCCVYVTSKDDREIQGLLNTAIGRFWQWTTQWKLTLSPAKTQAILFTLSTKPPEIDLHIAGETLPTGNTIKYLGITFDRRLTWTVQLDKMTKEGRRRLAGLQRLSGCSFGPDRSTMRGVYIGFIRSALEYGADVWGPGLSTSQEEHLERIQNLGLRIITGVPKSTPVETLRADCRLPPLRLRRQQYIQCRYEQARRLDDEHPLKRSIEEYRGSPPPKRLKRVSFTEAAETDNPCPNDRAPTPGSPFSPFESALPRLHVHPNLLTKCDSKDEHEKRAAGQETILKYSKEEEPFIHIYTDGSKSAAGNGGGYHIVNQGANLEGSFAAQPHQSIAEIESRAIRRAIQRLKMCPNITKDKNLVIFTDSQTTLHAIQLVLSSSAPPTAPIGDLLSNIQDLLDQDPTREIHLQYIPGHVGIAGNERADALAREGATQNPDLQSCSQETAKLMLANKLRATWHSEYSYATSESVEWYKYLRGNKSLSRKDPVDKLSGADLRLIAKFRLGRFPTQEYKYSIQTANNPYCICGQEETALHVLMDCRLPHRVAARTALPPAKHPSKLVFSNSVEVLKATADYLRLAMRPPPSADANRQL
jgi:ribonuclease HI